MNNKNGGGIIGGILVMLLCSLFATTGAYIILIAMMLISIIIITGKALITLIAKKSKNSLEERKEYQKLRREQITEAEPAINAKEQGRRPPKTFVLDPEAVAAKDKQGMKAAATPDTEKSVSENKSKLFDLKDRKQKKEQTASEGELPVLTSKAYLKKEHSPRYRKKQYRFMNRNYG
jgi:S-DNA-T family DNA segregation ATPase FtsK/SpoIIIE